VTSVTIAFEYLNSLSTIILVTLLQSLSRINRQSKTLVIKWYYEDDDEEILERGKYIAFSFDIPIEFIMTDDISGC
jgi:SiaC family regulatory phosphoprotein